MVRSAKESREVFRNVFGLALVLVPLYGDDCLLMPAERELCHAGNYRVIDARILGMDHESDLALLKVEEQGLPILAFGNSDKIHQGDLVFAIGSPLGLRNSVSINPGNSGGALVDAEGFLIGMNTFIVSQSGGNEGVGFATPGNIGVVVADVGPGSPAERAGLKRRDVILSVNGQAIETARQLENDVYQRQEGLTAEVQEQSNPWDPLAGMASPEKNLVPRLGILCIEIDQQVAQLMPELRRQYGLIVVAKSPEGQAQFIDLQPGDIIHAINNLSVASLTRFQNTVQELKAGDAVVLQVERDQRFRYVAFPME